MIAVLVALLMAGMPAQAPGDARLTVTVVDQTGAVIQNATVTVTPRPMPATPLAPVQTSDKGIATLQGLAPGRYSIQAEFPGFEPRLLKDVQLKIGDNKHVVVLAIQGLQDSVTVVARRARSGVGPAVDVRHGDDARADRGAVGRSRRDGAAAAGHGRRQRGHPRRQLRGRPAAAEVGDQGDPHHPRRVRRREPLRRRPVHRHHHAARHRAAAHQPQHAAARRLAERQERTLRRRDEGARAHAELQRRHRRLADQAEGVVLAQRQHADAVRRRRYFYLQHAGRHAGQRARRRAGRATTCSSSACSTTRITRDQTLRVNYNRNQFDDAATSASAATTPPSAATRPRIDNNYAAHPGGGAARPPLLHQHARVARLVRHRARIRSSRADDPASSTSSRPAASSCSGGTRRRRSTCSRISTTCAASTRSAPGSSSTAASTTPTTRTNYLGTYTFESLDAFSAGTPRSFTQPHRRSEHRLQERPGGPLPAGRHPRAQEPDAQPRPALRAADPPVGRQQLRPALRHHLVAGQERQDDAARQRRHLLRLAVDRHLRADAARRRLPPARAEHHRPVVSRSRAVRATARRPTATCSATTCGCSASRASAPASTAR